MRYLPEKNLTTDISLLAVATIFISLFSVSPSSALDADERQIKEISISPKSITLTGARAEQRVLVTGKFTDGTTRDLTRESYFRVMDENIAHVATVDKNMRGIKYGVEGSHLVKPVSDGETRLKIYTKLSSEKANTAYVPIKVIHAQDNKINFITHIQPILSKAGCSGGSCHGAEHGKNGFKLTVFSYDPELDYLAITRGAQMRRINRAEPTRSLILMKPTMAVPHGGGERFSVDSYEYNLLRMWIEMSAPRGATDAARVTDITVTPKSVVLTPGDDQHIVVMATYSDGTLQDVTRETQFSTNDDGVATVDNSKGITTAEGPGETGIAATYAGFVKSVRIQVPQQVTLPENAYDDFKTVSNPVDKWTLSRWKKLRIAPSEQCTDSEFIRRLSFDLIGTLPTPEEVKNFVADKTDTKRADLIDKLLERPEYVDYWTMEWADMLRVNRSFIKEKGMWAFYRFLYENVRDNTPWDKLTQEIITSRGRAYQNGAANYFRISKNPKDLAVATSQIFLGVRIQCAECHNHPFDQWTQEDYYSFSAFFARTKTKGGDEEGDEIVHFVKSGEINHPRTNEVMPPKGLVGKPYEKLPDDIDRRTKLAEWLTSPDNPFFAKNMANRIWRMFFATGIIEPTDDIRASNPPSNPELLDMLAKYFKENNYDPKQLIRLICSSQTYQLSSLPNLWNKIDRNQFTHYFAKRLGAEQLLDAVSSATGVPEKFTGFPAGTRAVQLPDPQVENYFLQVFGRPSRQIVCECERSEDANMAQALHMINSQNLQTKISDEKGRVAKLIKTGTSPGDIANALYLATFSRFPTPEESKRATAVLMQSPNRQEAAEDLIWALMNSREFVFNH